jgi:transcriptional/translational regulatory protein YebC/TACO1
MSGHSKWAQIKHKKGATDKKRAQLFSKLLKAISAAAKSEPNPQFNPRLRSAIEKAVSRASEEKNLEDLIIEAYGPGGIAMIITAITDNRNRTISEIKHLLNENEAKMANPGSVLWSFEQKAGNSEWAPKFPQETTAADNEKIGSLVSELEEHEDVQNVITNSN